VPAELEPAEPAPAVLLPADEPDPPPDELDEPESPPPPRGTAAPVLSPPDGRSFCGRPRSCDHAEPAPRVKAAAATTAIESC
jgi:hypothetical protein